MDISSLVIEFIIYPIDNVIQAMVIVVDIPEM